MNAASAAPLSTGEHVVRMAGLLTRFNLHPEAQIHPSWLPPDWPAVYRAPQRLGVAGQHVLSDLLRSRLPEPQGYDTDFGSSRKRLALLDGRELRMLALYCGFGAHRALLKRRGIGAPLRRQLRRFGPETASFVMERMPELSAFAMNNHALEQRPLGAGRVILRRGARLLLALMAADGSALLERTRLKLPRRLAAGELPVLTTPQRAQLDELIQLSIVPERLPAWHWLF